VTTLHADNQTQLHKKLPTRRLFQASSKRKQIKPNAAYREQSNMNNKPKDNLQDPQVLRELYFNSQVVFANPTFELLSDEQLRAYVRSCAGNADLRANQQAMYTLLTQRATTPATFDAVMNMYCKTLQTQDSNISDLQKEELMKQVQAEVKEKVFESELRRQEAEKLQAKAAKEAAANNNDSSSTAADEDINDPQPEPVCMFRSEPPLQANAQPSKASGKK
jgi:hypothetical protein